MNFMYNDDDNSLRVALQKKKNLEVLRANKMVLLILITMMVMVKIFFLNNILQKKEMFYLLIIQKKYDINNDSKI
jgi:hypothetical protein